MIEYQFGLIYDRIKGGDLKKISCNKYFLPLERYKIYSGAIYVDH